MFFKIAWRNARRSRNENLIYFTTLVISIASFYMIMALGKQDVIRFLSLMESQAVDKLLRVLMPAEYILGLCILFFLILFANKYQIQCRNAEFGIYLMHGMRKGRLLIQLFVEYLIISVLALVVGVLLGVFFAEIISLAIARVVGQGVITHAFSFSLTSVFFTAIGFGIVQFVTFLLVGGRLFLVEINELIHGNSAKSQDLGSVKKGLLFSFVGCVLLGSAYYLVLNFYTFVDVLYGLNLPIGIVLGIFGTMVLIKGLAMLLGIVLRLKKNPKGLFAFTLRQYQENVTAKWVSVGLASVLMMFSFVMLTRGMTSFILYGNDLQKNINIDFTVVDEEDKALQYLETASFKDNIDAPSKFAYSIIKDGERSETYLDFSAIIDYIQSDLPEGYIENQQFITRDVNDPPKQYLYGLLESNKYPNLIPLSSYNNVLVANGYDTIQLGDNEAILYLNPIFASQNIDDVLNELNTYFANQTFTFDNIPMSFKTGVKNVPLAADQGILISSAMVVSDNMFETYADPDPFVVYNFNLKKSYIKEVGYLQGIMDIDTALRTSGYRYQSFLTSYGRNLFYLAAECYSLLYLGFMFLVLACATIALQFLTQTEKVKIRYLYVSYLGATTKDLQKSLRTQLFLYFLLPVVLAVVSSGVGLKFTNIIFRKTNIFELKQIMLMSGVFFVCVVIMLIYAMAVRKVGDKIIAKEVKM